ncbi:hypothetical protein Lepto7376_4529 [[Leptolyngbya] sp. PCC 7376]|uniref:hypothetical protein n=1 Tax=[Leptolyngbya] sp. PCC 7376 TaxID=111781 RepID=UPI00029F4CD9|nr:hypothetical protein [[Leptolyngbya] sp. PCC 7376]AFY40627.1 hypothetical protein Lepto7376_4529 [[Leptolyngbya] sp. PCC 7376]
MINLALISGNTGIELGLIATLFLALLGFMWKIYTEIQKASYRMGKLDQTILNLLQDVNELKGEYKQIWQYLFKKFADFKNTGGRGK